MHGLVRPAFHTALGALAADSVTMPLDGINESVFRYHFCQGVASQHPTVDQWVECDRIDLVLRERSDLAYIEFKFYLRRPRISPNDGTPLGTKGGPGSQNLREFRSCIERLHARPSQPGLHKYVALAYADEPSERGRKFADYLDRYQHPDEEVTLDVLSNIHHQTQQGRILHGQLLTVDGLGGPA